MNSRDLQHEHTLRMHSIIGAAALRSNMPDEQKKAVVKRAIIFINKEDADYQQYVLERTQQKIRVAFEDVLKKGAK